MTPIVEIVLATLAGIGAAFGALKSKDITCKIKSCCGSVEMEADTQVEEVERSHVRHHHHQSKSPRRSRSRSKTPHPIKLSRQHAHADIIYNTDIIYKDEGFVTI